MTPFARVYAASRSICGLVAGAIVALVVYWIGAVILFVLLRSAPMSIAPTAADAIAHLAFAAAAGFAGGIAALKVAGYARRAHAAALALLLVVSLLLEFARRAGMWPAWFPYAMALACALGVGLAARFELRRSG